ncbi:hypothetical protein J6590_070263 [Homalodisca vitripennis]|nr:hypothetical protein J6590_070263 [Homalodisca vitripennis]
MANLLQRYNGFFALISTLDAMEDHKDAGKRREGETSPHSEPKSFSKKTCK